MENVMKSKKFILEEFLMTSRFSKEEWQNFIKEKSSNSEDDCWLGNEKHKRVAYAVFNGDIPENMFVSHSCNSDTCLNPRHLVLRNEQQLWENMMDNNRGQIRFLTAEHKKEIKELYAKHYTKKELMEKFSTSMGVLNYVLSH